MSWNPTQDPECPSFGCGALETLIIPRARDIGAMSGLVTIVGYGAAQKEAVAKMVQTRLALPELPAPDAADALAIALTYAQSANSPIPDPSIKPV